MNTQDNIMCYLVAKEIALAAINDWMSHKLNEGGKKQISFLWVLRTSLAAV